jgi:hypothetical protein
VCFPAGLVSDLGRFPFVLKAGLIDSASPWRPIETQYLFIAEIPADLGWAIISTLFSLFHVPENSNLPFTTSIKVSLDTTRHARILVDLLLGQSYSTCVST